jgi:hypothetical protein
MSKVYDVMMHFLIKRCFLCSKFNIVLVFQICSFVFLRNKFEG